jgi:hypothetical protein
MKVQYALEKLKTSDRALIADLLMAFAVAVAFTGFAVTVMQMDSMAGSNMVFPPGKIVYM